MKLLPKRQKGRPRVSNSVRTRVYPERIVIAGEGQVICEHRRFFARSHQRKSTTTVFEWRHYLTIIQRKPGALRDSAPFAELPHAFRALQQRMLKTPGDFTSSEVDEALTRQLHLCEFLEDAHNVVLVGGPGTSKTHLATAIGVQAIEHRRNRVRFFSTIELVTALETREASKQTRRQSVSCCARRIICSTGLKP